MLSENEVVKLYEDILMAVAKNYMDIEPNETKGTIYESIVFGLGRVLEREFTKISADIVSAKHSDCKPDYRTVYHYK